MPSRYVIKEFEAGGIYHVYNRGVEKRKIFVDDHDYRFFLFLIKSYLTPAEEQKDNPETQLKRGLFVGRISLLCYALMPNHYHLVIKQENESDLKEFMRAVMTSYATYFNKKYKRTGSLFQGVYKGILVREDEYLLHLTRYIHINPIAKRLNLFEGEPDQKGSTFLNELRDGYTSYGDYIGLRNTKWLNTDIILEYFETSPNQDQKAGDLYRDFVENFAIDSRERIGKYSID